MRRAGKENAASAPLGGSIETSIAKLIALKGVSRHSAPAVDATLRGVLEDVETGLSTALASCVELHVTNENLREQKKQLWSRVEQLTATHEADTRRLRGVSALAQLAGAWARATRLLDRAARAARARAFVRWCASSADAGVRAARSARGPMRPDDAKLDDLRRARLRAVVARAGIGRPLRLAWRRMLEYCAEVSVFYYDVSNPCDD